jgi:hypothetical protein
MAAASSTASAISSHGLSSAGRDIRKATRVPRHRLSTLALLAVTSLALVLPKAGAPVLVWNASPSVPIGVYRCVIRSKAATDSGASRPPVLAQGGQAF